MECQKCSKNYFKVETDEAIYQFEFAEVQFEITGKCNMNCVHCRGAFDEKVDLPIEQIEKVLKFVRKYSPNFKEVTLSGGEPFMHKQFKEILQMVRNSNVINLTLTTNGSFINKEIIEYIKELRFKRVLFSVSLDSIDKEEHNIFRNHKNAYDIAMNAFKLLREYGDDSFYISLRSTITPQNITNMEEIAKVAIGLSLNRVSFASVLPSGNAINNPDILMTGEQLMEFCSNVKELYLKYKGIIDVSSNEALKWQTRMDELLKEEGKLLLNSCPAGTLSFNVNSNGDITPCSLLNIKILNIMELTEYEIEEAYRNSPIVKSLLTRSLKGKCGKCKYKSDCSGCRVRALNLKGDYLEEDPSCVRGPF